ncbi:hypothetical protein EAE96_008973 [Botrytis aclada]|nr:hypothetical protein EAE96_008973 [Botrytis aclada]
MPSNYSSVPPQEVTGTTQLPLSRIKKIIGTDQDINMCSNNAAFVITLATEMFIQYMAESGHNVVKSERKPRRNIQYRDLCKSLHSSAVSSRFSIHHRVQQPPTNTPQPPPFPTSTTSNSSATSFPRRSLSNSLKPMPTWPTIS